MVMAPRLWRTVEHQPRRCHGKMVERPHRRYPGRMAERQHHRCPGSSLEEPKTRNNFGVDQGASKGIACLVPWITAYGYCALFLRPAWWYAHSRATPSVDIFF